jgi:hypothetical protein
MAAIAVLPPSPILAQTNAPAGFARWSPGADAARFDGTDLIGVIEEPLANGQYAPDVGVPVRGWVVDRYSATRPDRVLVYEGAPPQNGGRLLVEAQPYIWRMDVGNLLGSSAYKVSGFEGVIPPGALSAGSHTLTIAAHLGAIGWWTAGVRIVLGPDAAPALDGTVRFTCVTPSSGSDLPRIEVAVTSARSFPVRDQIVVLQVGAARSLLSRYPADGDLHTLIFTFTPEELASVRAGDAMLVSYGLTWEDWNPPLANIWHVGAVDATDLAPLAACGRAVTPMAERPGALL